jgi:folate-dependent tRNA-U54 methylase TrmFO/GidA
MNEGLQMNYVETQNCSKSKAAMTEQAVGFCIQEMMPRMKSLDITVEYSSTRGDDQAACLAVTTREFEIEVSKKLKGDELLRVLCHEMVHVKQYARRELHLDNTSDYTTYAEYADQWFEREAFELEEILLKKLKLFQNNG